MACIERPSTSSRLSSLGSPSFMLAFRRVECLSQDDAPTGALTDVERKTRHLAGPRQRPMWGRVRGLSARAADCAPGDRIPGEGLDQRQEKLVDEAVEE